MQNVWTALHPLLEGDPAYDLGDYNGIFTNEEVILALKQGLKEAQN